MYKESDFVARCEARGLGKNEVGKALDVVRGLEREAAGPGGTLADAKPADVEAYLARLLARGPVDEAALMAMARYFAVIGSLDLASRLLAYLLPVGVLPAFADRLDLLEGGEVRDRVLSGLGFPPPGSPPEAYPAATARFVTALVDELGSDDAAGVLTWNVHGIPASAFARERARFVELGSVDAWLADYHGRQVEELAAHAADGTLWYEQRITPAVVDFVRANPEIQGGAREGRVVYVTKIPYNPAAYLASRNHLERRRLACHCPLAASSIREGGAGVPAAWCACSAGYTKFIFDVVFGEETKATVLASALEDAELCRFAVRIPESVAVP